ncbi:MAG TPA: glutaredoxin family protein [Holophagaceae bacterium]|nr:glutaredoxin family protein [Holophagaceae bacterium]
MATAADLKGLDITIYSAGWCPDCRRLEGWLEREGLHFPIVDIEAVDGAAERLERETGKRAIPFLLVNGRTWVRGYHKELPTRFDPALLVQEVTAAAAK